MREKQSKGRENAEGKGRGSFKQGGQQGLNEKVTFHVSQTSSASFRVWYWECT